MAEQRASVTRNADRIKRVEDELQRLDHIVCGNGQEGMDEILRITKRMVEDLSNRFEEHMQAHLQTQQEIKNAVKPTESDVRMMLRIIQREYGLDAMGNKTAFNAEVNPGRRAEDQKSKSDKLMEWFVNRVLPGLVTGLIATISTIILLLAVTHWTDLGL